MKRTVSILSLLVLTLLSCKKEGCTNPNADNYNPNADKDDCSCLHTGKIVIWWDEEGREWLEGLGAEDLQIHVAGVPGTIKSTALTYTSEPVCNSTSGLYADFDLAKNRFASVNVKVFTDNDIKLVDKSFALRSEECIIWKLEEQ